MKAIILDYLDLDKKYFEEPSIGLFLGLKIELEKKMKFNDIIFAQKIITQRQKNYQKNGIYESNSEKKFRKNSYYK